jgi:hypothetical protein
MNLVDYRTFSGDAIGRGDWIMMDIIRETFKTPIWQAHSSEVSLNLNKLEISLVQD